jgi:hypothetical protein
LSSFLVDRYYGGRRNETTDFNYELYLERGVGGTTDTEYIDIELVINVPPEQDIIYAPEVFEVLKFAWIKYYSFLLLTYMLLYRGLYAFVIKNKVFDSVELTQLNMRALLNHKKGL